jgi:hypothetical protein
MPRNGQPDLAIGHDGVLALASDPETDLGKHPDSLRMTDTRELGILYRNHSFFYRAETRFLCFNSQPLAYRDLDIFDGFFPRCALRMASGQRGTTDCPSFI